MILGIRKNNEPMERIRHSEAMCYVQEGHGGRGVETWPIYRFFCEYIKEGPELAKAHFVEWYLDQFIKYRDVPKRLGGMRGGSLARTVNAMMDGNDGDNAFCANSSGGNPAAVKNDNTLHEAIAARVMQRFELLESIRNRGYVPAQSDPVLGIESGEYVYLLGGHHRVAALRALGWTYVPSVLVFKSWFHYRTWFWYRVVYRKATVCVVRS